MSILHTLTIRSYLALGRLTSVKLEREEGQTLAEYALILALIAVVVVGAVVVLGNKLHSMFDSVGSDI